MRAVSLFIDHFPEYEGPRRAFDGWIVDGTNDTMAVDERYQAEPLHCELAIWAITHVPSGRRLRRGEHTKASTFYGAIAIAFNFYSEATALGIDLKKIDPMGPYYQLTGEQRLAFWRRVSGQTQI